MFRRAEHPCNEICLRCSRKRRGVWKYGFTWRFCDYCDRTKEGWGSPVHMSMIARGFGAARAQPIVPPEAPFAEEE